MAEVTNGNKLINYQNLADFKEQIDIHYSPSTHGHGNITSGGTIAGAASKVVVTDANGKITSSSDITTTKLGYLNNVSANIQTQLNDKAPASHTSDSATTSTLGHVKLTTGNCSSTYTAGMAAASKHSHSNATTGASGYMSSDDKKKLDGIAAGADAVEVTTHTTIGTKVATIKVNSTNYEIKVSASDLGVSNALHFIGEAITTAPTSGTYKSFTHGTTQLYVPVTTTGAATEVDMLAGDVFIYSGKEFICTTSGKNGTNVCKEFGDEGSYALKTYKVTGTTDLEGGGTLTGTTEIKHKEVLGSAKTSIGGVSNGTITVPIVSANKYGHITTLTSTTITPTTSAFTKFKVGSTSIVADNKHDELTLSAGTNITLTPDAGNDKITIAATDTNDYHKHVYTTGTKIATGVTNEDIFVPVATSAIAGAIKVGYTESGKNYPVKLDSNNNAYVNVPWTDTDTNTHYTSKNVVCASATGTTNAAATNGNVYLNHLEEGAVKSSHEISGKGATTVICDANGNITISSSDNYHKAVYTAGTKIATGVSNQDIFVPLATSSIGGVIKIGYSENGQNYPVELDSNGKAFVNVPWTDKNDDNWYTNKLIATSSPTQTGIATHSTAAYLNNLVYDKNDTLSGLSSSITFTGAGAAKVSVISGGVVRISATSNYKTGLYVTSGTSTGNTDHGCGSDSSTHHTVDMKLFDDSTLRGTVSFSGSNICLNAVKSSASASTISLWAPGCTKTEIDALFA